MNRCPHCGGVHRDRSHPEWTVMCADRARWTRAERDEWRDQVRAEDPSVLFVGTYDADRLG
jgi:Ribonuclease G/E